MTELSTRETYRQPTTEYCVMNHSYERINKGTILSDTYYCHPATCLLGQLALDKIALSFYDHSFIHRKKN